MKKDFVYYEKLLSIFTGWQPENESVMEHYFNQV